MNDVKYEPCTICGILNRCTISHHIEYTPKEKTVQLCYSCHGKLHNSRDLQDKTGIPAPDRPRDFIPNDKILRFHLGNSKIYTTPQVFKDGQPLYENYKDRHDDPYNPIWRIR